MDNYKIDALRSALAFHSHGETTPGDVVETAKTFEAFLAGEKDA